MKSRLVLLRNGPQIGLQSVAKDFDTDHSAGETFNVEPGDVVKVYIVDDLVHSYRLSSPRYYNSKQPKRDRRGEK